jgi:hypothetical protein
MMIILNNQGVKNETTITSNHDIFLVKPTDFININYLINKMFSPFIVTNPRYTRLYYRKDINARMKVKD